MVAAANEGYVFIGWTLEGEIVSMEPTYTFTVTGPVNLTANFNVVLTQQLEQGWNWWSTSLDITLNDLKAALVEALPGTEITIQDQNNNTKYNPNNNRWSGRLNALDVAYMYKISVVADCEIRLEGLPVNPVAHPVTISNGTNWIAFPLGESMSLNDAFAGFAVDGDMVQSQTINARNIRGRWQGRLSSLEPGEGYIYQSISPEDRIFVFPAGSK